MTIAFQVYGHPWKDINGLGLRAKATKLYNQKTAKSVEEDIELREVKGLGKTPNRHSSGSKGLTGGVSSPLMGSEADGDNNGVQLRGRGQRIRVVNNRISM